MKSRTERSIERQFKPPPRTRTFPKVLLSRMAHTLYCALSLERRASSSKGTAKSHPCSDREEAAAASSVSELTYTARGFGGKRRMLSIEEGSDLCMHASSARDYIRIRFTHRWRCPRAARPPASTPGSGGSSSGTRGCNKSSGAD